MLSLRILTASFLLIITGCQARESKPATANLGPQPVAPQPVVDTSRVVVFPYDAKRDQNRFQVYDQKPSEYIPHVFKPISLSSAELIQVETLLRACIDEYNRPQVAELQKLRKSQPQSEFKADDFIINLPKYKRQLVAVTNTKGEKEVWINCFCDASGIDWHYQMVTVKDGGNCFFNLKVNLAKKKWYDLMVNDWA